MVVSVWQCMGVFVILGVCVCMCDCVVLNFFLFLFIMLVLLHFMQNKLNIIIITAYLSVFIPIITFLLFLNLYFCF